MIKSIIEKKLLNKIKIVIYIYLYITNSYNITSYFVGSC